MTESATPAAAAKTYGLKELARAYSDGDRNLAITVDGKIVGTAKTDKAANKMLFAHGGGTYPLIADYVSKNYAKVAQGVSFGFSECVEGAKLFNAVMANGAQTSVAVPAAGAPDPEGKE